MMLTRITPPTHLPVNINEVKEYCRIEDTDNDPIIERFINSAVELAENATSRRFITQQWRLDLDSLEKKILIPYPNLISIDGFTYYDTLNVQRSFTGYDVIGVGGVGVVSESVNEYWPTAYPRPDRYQITFTCGYGDYTAVPQALKDAISTIVWFLFDGRGDQINDSFMNFLLSPFMMRGFYE